MLRNATVAGRRRAPQHGNTNGAAGHIWQPQTLGPGWGEAPMEIDPNAALSLPLTLCKVYLLAESLYHKACEAYNRS
jgi:hypothetical protein